MKKILLVLGMAAAIAAPIATVVSCDMPGWEKDKEWIKEREAEGFTHYTWVDNLGNYTIIVSKWQNGIKIETKDLTTVSRHNFEKYFLSSLHTWEEL